MKFNDYIFSNSVIDITRSFNPDLNINCSIIKVTLNDIENELTIEATMQCLWAQDDSGNEQLAIELKTQNKILTYLGFPEKYLKTEKANLKC